MKNIWYGNYKHHIFSLLNEGRLCSGESWEDVLEFSEEIEDNKLSVKVDFISILVENHIVDIGSSDRNGSMSEVSRAIRINHFTQSIKDLDVLIAWDIAGIVLDFTVVFESMDILDQVFSSWAVVVVQCGLKFEAVVFRVAIFGFFEFGSFEDDGKEDGK